MWMLAAADDLVALWYLMVPAMVLAMVPAMVPAMVSAIRPCWTSECSPRPGTGMHLCYVDITIWHLVRYYGSCYAIWGENL
eukprot:936423-Rhodomonas_salina.1